MTPILTALGLAQHYRQFLTLLAVMIAAAGIYYWLEMAKADRLLLLNDAVQICEAAGAPYQPGGSKQKVWGDDCLSRVRDLVQLDHQLAEGNAAALIEAMRERTGKENADAALAAAMSKRTADAVAKMEAANAAVENDRVGPGWAAAVNELGGMR